MKLKKSSIFTKIIIAALLIYAVTTLVTLRTKIENAKALEEDLARQVEDKIVTNEELQYEIDHNTDDEVIEGVARDKLGLVDPNEHVYYAS